MLFLTIVMQLVTCRAGNFFKNKVFSASHHQQSFFLHHDSTRLQSLYGSFSIVRDEKPLDSRSLDFLLDLTYFHFTTTFDWRLASWSMFRYAVFITANRRISFDLLPSNIHGFKRFKPERIITKRYLGLSSWLLSLSRTHS